MSEVHYSKSIPDDEDVPLLGNKKNPNRRISTSSNKSRASHKITSNQITDFDQVDSWGMLHESDTDYDLERAERIANSNAFIDHRPSLVNASFMSSKHMMTKKTRPSTASVSSKGNSSIGTKKIPYSSQNIIGPSHLSTDDVVIDVDALLEDVKKNAKKSSKGRNPQDSINSHDDGETDEDEEFDEEDEYNSRPSSRGSSSNSSLDDVCLPLDDELGEKSKIWPDISVLEEFSKEETDRLRRQAIEDAEAFHYRYDTEDDDVFNTDSVGLDDYNGPTGQVNGIKTKKEGILFSKPIVTNIDVPELGNKQVNEAELMQSGRLRPKRIAPWHLMQRQGSRNSKQNSTLRGRSEDSNMRDNFLVGRNIQYPPHIISNNPEHFKFTYFRIDLDSTVHSPTISGLLQPGQRFEDLFVSSVYTNKNNSKAMSTNNIPTIRETIAPIQNLNAAIPRRVASSVKFQSVSPLDTSLPVSGSGNSNNIHHVHTNTTTVPQLQNTLYKNPSSLSMAFDEDVSPFWLDVSNPTEEEMKVLSKTFGIHPLTTEDIFLGEVREKVELFKDYYLICFRSFDIVAERHIRKKKEKTSLADSTILSNSTGNLNSASTGNSNGVISLVKSLWGGSKKTNSAETAKLLRRRASTMSRAGSLGNVNVPDNNPTSVKSNSSYDKRKSIIRRREEREKFKRKSGDRHKPRAGELEPLNVYIIVFRTGVLTFHFAPTPHPINVRRRARLLKDYLNVTADWIAYALIDDITDAFGPMIELIEDEVYDIEDAILKMNHNDSDSDSDSSDNSSDSDSSSDSSDASKFYHTNGGRRRRNSDNDTSRLRKNGRLFADNKHSGINIPRGSVGGRYSVRSNYMGSSSSTMTGSTSSSSSRSRGSDISTFNANLIGWKKKGDMLRRIGDCRKRVMSIVRLLGAKADVIKGFAKKYNGQWDSQPQAEIGMYLDDIQDHIITMVSSLNHFEKLLSRSHSNYLAQINIDMTKVNNDMNDVLGKITIIGTIVLPMNVVTGLWGMNVIVPGQHKESLQWFIGILTGMITLAYFAYIYTKRKFGF